MAKCPVGYRRVKQKCQRIRPSEHPVALLVANTGVPGIPLVGLGALEEAAEHFYVLFARVAGTDHLAAVRGSVTSPFIGIRRQAGATAEELLAHALEGAGFKVPERFTPTLMLRVPVGMKRVPTAQFPQGIEVPARTFDLFVLRGGAVEALSPEAGSIGVPTAVTGKQVGQRLVRFPGLDDARIVRELYILRDEGAADIRTRETGRESLPVRTPERIVVDRPQGSVIALERATKKLDKDVGGEYLLPPSEEAEREIEMTDALHRELRIPIRSFRYRKHREGPRTEDVPSRDFPEWVSMLDARRAEATEAAERKYLLDEGKEEEANAHFPVRAARVRAMSNQAKAYEDIRVWPGEDSTPARVAGATHLVYNATDPMPDELKRGKRTWRRVGKNVTGLVTYVRSDLPENAPLKGMTAGSLQGLGGLSGEGRHTTLGAVISFDEDEDAPSWDTAVKPVSPLAPTRTVALRRAGVSVELPTAPTIEAAAPVYVEPVKVAVRTKHRLERARVDSDLMPFLRHQTAGKDIVRVYRGTGQFTYPMNFNATLPGGERVTFTQVQSDVRDENGVPYKVYAGPNPNFRAEGSERRADTIQPSKRLYNVVPLPDPVTYDVNKANITLMPDDVAVVRSRGVGAQSQPITAPWPRETTFGSELAVKTPGLIALSEDGIRAPVPLHGGVFAHQTRGTHLTFDGMGPAGRVRARMSLANLRAMDLQRPSVFVEWGRQKVDSKGIFIFSAELARVLQAWMGKLANEQLGKLGALSWVDRVLG